ncbi:MAG: glycosyltransferase [Dehalococcoidia bacterium]|nr:glycosyltransferase [Dehalococcoidia bacterium]
MTYQLVIFIGLVVFALNLALNLRALKEPEGNATMPEPAPFVSVLIPARDEEANIESCVKSLQQQDYHNFEILVLDDNSSDGTANIVEQLAATDNRTCLISGEPLCEGWAGKPFACYQLAQKAKGDWLLFVDADTVHAPHMLRSVMSLALKSGCSLLSGFPRQLTTSLPEKVSIPLMYFIILSWLPLWWLQSFRKPKPSLAIGQFLLFPREEYWRIGGHEAVKSRILEDVWLGIEVNRHGGRHIAINLAPVVSCHMYRSMKSMWEGFIKWMYSVAALSSAALLGMLTAGFLFFLLPFFFLWKEMFWIGSPGAWRSLVTFQVVVILAMRWLTDKHFRESFISALLHPLGFSFVILAVFYAFSRRIKGSHVRWKERLYGGASGVE